METHQPEDASDGRLGPDLSCYPAQLRGLIEVKVDDRAPDKLECLIAWKSSRLPFLEITAFSPESDADITSGKELSKLTGLSQRALGSVTERGSGHNFLSHNKVASHCTV